MCIQSLTPSPHYPCPQVFKPGVNCNNVHSFDDGLRCEQSVEGVAVFGWQLWCEQAVFEVDRQNLKRVSFHDGGQIVPDVSREFHLAALHLDANLAGRHGTDKAFSTSTFNCTFRLGR